MSVKEQYESIKSKIAVLNSRLTHLQSICNHHGAQKKHSRNDSYDGTEFWTQFKCPDCGKNWIEEGSK